MSYSDFKQVQNNWASATTKGNNFYKEDNYKTAIKHYHHALFYSELMVRSSDEAERFNLHVASPFFVSCLNIANNLWAMQELKKAGDYFFHNVWNLKMLSEKEGISNAAFVEATKNWEKAVLALIDFHTQTNQELKVDFWKKETYDQIKNTRKWLVQNQATLN
ncbi:MAG TPA: hypothetical protein VNI52_12915 [Sphingobacteriaceae bacterium]|nr:hypothetical protein [Sphingobacteriaceae bacterium]